MRDDAPAHLCAAAPPDEASSLSAPPAWLFDRLPVGVAILDGRLRFRHINRAMAQVNGVPAEAHIGRTVRQVLPMLADDVEPILRRVLDSGRPLPDLLVRGRTHSDPESLHDWLASYYPLVDQAGRPMVMAICTEVTAMRQAEHALRRQHEQTQTILDALPAFVWYKDADDRILRINRTAADALGLPVEEVEGRFTGEFYPEAAQYRRDDLEILRTGRPRRGTIEPVHHGDGELEWVRTDKVPIVDADGRIDGVLVVASDVTDLKRTEQALRREERRFDRAVRGASDGLWDWNLDTDATWFAPRFGELLGYDRLPGAISSLWALLHPGDRPDVLAALADCIDHDLPCDLECRLRLGPAAPAPQRHRWFRLRAALSVHEPHDAVEPAGPRRWIAGSIQDVGDRHEAAELLRRQNRELEQFVYTVSHDLKSPLVTCEGFVGVLEEDLHDHFAGTPPEALTDSLEAIRGAAVRMNRLITDLLTLSRSGRPSGERQMLDTDGLVEDLTAELGFQLEQAGARIRTRPPLPAVWGDGLGVRQVLANLLTNAIKYGCPRPGATVTVHGRTEGQRTLLAVGDAGPGIPEKFHQRIFGLFKRLDPGDRRDGTGVGLTIVRKVMAAHGGGVRLESAPGKGCTFWLSFPNRPPRSGHLEGQENLRGQTPSEPLAAPPPDATPTPGEAA